MDGPQPEMVQAATFRDCHEQCHEQLRTSSVPLFQRHGQLSLTGRLPYVSILGWGSDLPMGHAHSALISPVWNR